MTDCAACTINYGLVDAHAFRELGIVPRFDGLVLWKGLLWRGLPYPLRLKIVFKVRRRGFRVPVRKSIHKFAGCGCLDRPKRWLERLSK